MGHASTPRPMDRREPPTAEPTPPRPPARRCWLLLAVLFVALVARTINLGGFSLWLDEILQVVWTRGSFASAWSALARDLAQPPLDGLISWLVLRAGAGETAHRLVNVAWGLATVAVLALWAARRVSPRAGLVVGLLTTASPFHVRYSQEIRPYALSLLLAVLALRALDEMLDAEGGERRGPWGWTILVAASIGVVWAHHLGTLFLAATCGAWAVTHWLSRRRRATPEGTRSNLLPRLGLAAACVALASVPLLAQKAALLGRPAEAPAQEWTLAAAARRWEAITVAGSESAPLSPWGALLLILALAGALAALRRSATRRWLAAAVLGTAGVELALLAADHWSNARYDLFGWPFLILLAGLGVEALSAAAAHRWQRPPAGAVVAAILTAAALAGELRGLYAYYEEGRPHWDRVAELAHGAAPPGTPLLAVNEWTRLSLSYYLEGSRREVVSVEGGAALVERAARESGCAILVVAGYPQHPGLESFLRGQQLLAGFPPSDARVYAVAGRPGGCPERPSRPLRPGPEPRSPWSRLRRAAPRTENRRSGG